MDDCDLEKLSAVPAKITPKFHRNILEYESTVPSSVEKVKVDCLTSDSGASYQVFGADGEKVIPLTEGAVTEIKIEVSAEDGTTKSYFIRVKRLSASDATLEQLSLSCGKLDPTFVFDCYDYTCSVPCNVLEVTIKAVPPDPKCAVSVPNASSEFMLPLQCGTTTVSVNVTSINGSNTKTYNIIISRKQLPWPIMLKDLDIAKKLECPMTLTALYNPISIAGSDPKVTMSQPCIDMLTRRSKVNPMDETLLEKDWKIIDAKLDKDLSDAVTCSVFKYKGAADELPLRSMPSYITTCEHKLSLEIDSLKVTSTAWYKADFEGTSTKTKNIEHKVEVRNWEKRFQRMASQSDVNALLKEADKRKKAYWNKLPQKPGQTVRYADGEAPADELLQLCICMAAAIKANSKDAKLHMGLAFGLEEQYYLKEMFGLQKQDEDAEEVGAGTDIAAQESSKLEDCIAICKLRGVSATAPIALQLKAIDEEKKSLLENGQSSRADYVQSLYVWRSKQAVKGDQSSQYTDENAPMAQAFLKYKDALALDANNFLCNYHVGRMLIAQGEYTEAVLRLQQAAGLKPTFVEARFLLGLALCLRDGGPGERLSEALSFLHEGLDHILMRRQSDAEKETEFPTVTHLHAEDTWRLPNVQALRALFVLATHLQKNPQSGLRSAKEVYHCVCLHAAMALCSMFHRGETLQQLEWLLLDSHYALLELMMAEKPMNSAWVAQRCRYLSAMIRSSTLPRDSKLLALQEKVCQKLVSINPCNSESLYLLGMAQLLMYDSGFGQSANEEALNDARQSLQASVDLEGKPSAGEVPSLIADQKWWQDKAAAEKAKSQATAQSSSTGKTQPAGPSRGAAANRARGRGATPSIRGAPAAARGRAGAKAPVRGRGAPAARGKAVSPATSTSNTKLCKEEEPVKEPAVKSATVESQTSKAAPINRTTYHSRLGLARALSRTDERKDEARSRYEEVMKMAPENHDAYIELADLLVKTAPLAAVDIYCKFPSKEVEGEESFDDAYISGEIVRILMKHEKFDDARLVDHMIKWGRVMGIGVLEKYMEILDSKFKTNMLKSIYAGVHGKPVDDPDLTAFFKFKCWL